MKIRIQGNSLRLRLTKSEVDMLAKAHVVSDAISFGENSLKYSLSTVEVEEVQASFHNSGIVVQVPLAIAKRWTETGEVTISANQPINEQENLVILIEKDFQCLVPRDNEEEHDMYKNPLANN